MSHAYEHVFAVILAGGSGTRFWPKSRLKSPKQLCQIGPTDLTMIETTLKRLDGFIPPERRLIVTHKDQIALTRTTVGDKCGHFLAEPEAKNTAAALALAALELRHLSKQDPNTVMVSLHADHVIEDENAFRTDIKRSIQIAERGQLTLMGIKPRSPETGFGYIERGETLEGAGEGYRVASFREKPDFETAKSYCDSGRFLWNSGYFIWQVETILAELREYLPATVDALNGLAEESAGSLAQVGPERLAATYGQLQSIAIDNAVLEVSSNVAVIETDFGWHDVGSWDALDTCFGTDADGNFLSGDTLLLDTKNTTIDTDESLVVCIGVEDLVVVKNKNAILVCPKSRAQDVKKIVEKLKSQGRQELL